jgi:hypothetical protein
MASIVRARTIDHLRGGGGGATADGLRTPAKKEIARGRIDQRTTTTRLVFFVEPLFSHLLVALVGNLVFYLRIKSEFKSVTPDTAFRFNSKDL